MLFPVSRRTMIRFSGTKISANSTTREAAIPSTW